MDQRDIGQRAEPGEFRRAGGVGLLGGGSVGFGLIDGGVSGGVDHQAGLHPSQRGREAGRRGEIHLWPAEADQIPAAGLFGQGGGQLAGGADHQNGRARHQAWNQASQSARRGSCVSLSDSNAAPGATGQGKARSGSSQITPRSASRS